MATISEIINYAKLMYPRTNDISNSDCIIIINQLIDEVHNKLLRSKWNYEKFSEYSISGQASYGLPSDCNADNIISVNVSTDIYATEFDTYSYVGVLDDNEDIVDNKYMISDGLIYLFNGIEPLSIDNLIIDVFYYKTPSYVSAVTDIPEFDSKFHNLLKYGLIQISACIGDNPDLSIADYWQRKFDEELVVAKQVMLDKFNNAPLKTMQINEYW